MTQSEFFTWIIILAALFCLFYFLLALFVFRNFDATKKTSSEFTSRGIALSLGAAFTLLAFGISLGVIATVYGDELNRACVQQVYQTVDVSNMDSATQKELIRNSC